MRYKLPTWANDFAIPRALGPRGRRAAGLIIDYLRRNDMLAAGGCRVFYTPRAWARRKEKYGLKSILVVAHDGGDHAPVFNGQNPKAAAQLEALLNAQGLWTEGCTCWYTAVYDHRKERHGILQPRT